MKIQVTQEDIDNGGRFEPCSCPIARAMKRALKKVVWVVSVNDQDNTADWCYDFDFNKHHHRLPEKAALLACDFDGGLKVKPIEFDLEIPA